MITPPAQTAPPPASAPRPEVPFPGFNGHPLKGSVLAAQGHPFFAVIVAGTGPMDRNWSGPHLPPGKAGADFAEWLQARGIGSLRFDKRFVGSRDAKLDISLEAQAGDVTAAIAHARTLPEAKGRRILLIGHGEGALVALVAATEADGLLLIAPPARPMSRTLLDLVERQLPSDQRAPNLAWLESAFAALKAGNPLPQASASVHPAIVRLAKSLSAPESLPFVKGTLDMDPLLLAGRPPIPVALAWGEQDVLALPPSTLPTGFRPKVLRLPGTNHLLRRETRPLTELDPVKARTTYGSDTPMADLAPLAEWLGTLK